MPEEKENKNQPRTTEQLVEVLRPITRKAESILGRVRGIAWIYLAGAVTLWLILVAPGGVSFSWLLVFSVIGLLVLALPAGIMFLFYAALVSVVNLPARLLEKAGVGETHARSILETVRSPDAGSSSMRAGRLLRTLYDIRGLVLDSKGMLLEYTALLRLANPFVLAMVGIATVAGFCVVVTAAIGLLLVLI